MKRLPHHLTNENGIFFFRIRVPCDLSQHINQKFIKRSLKTESSTKARLLSYAYTTLYNTAFDFLRSCHMSKPSLNDVLTALQQGKARTYEIELPNGLKIKADGADDHARAMEAVKALQCLQGATTAPKQPEAATVENFTLEEVIEKYLLSFEDNVVKTRQIRTKALTEFNEYFNKNKTSTRFSINHIKAVFVEEYIVFLKKSLSVKTVTNKISYIKSFFDYAIKLEYYKFDKNPAQSLISMSKKEVKQSAENGFTAFTEKELIQIYSIENLKQNKLLATRWGILLGLYTGARVSEIGQLRLQDFYYKDGLLCVKICEDHPSQSLKNSASKRSLPIHPDLIKLGLEKRLENLKKSNQEQFFPNANAGVVNGMGNWLSKAFTRYINDYLNCDKSKKYGFHSLRKNLVHSLQNLDIPEEKRIQFLGHEGSGSVHSVNYSRKYTEKELLEIVEVALHKNLDFTKYQEILF